MSGRKNVTIECVNCHNEILVNLDADFVDGSSYFGMYNLPYENCQNCGRHKFWILKK